MILVHRYYAECYFQLPPGNSPVPSNWHAVFFKGVFAQQLNMITRESSLSLAYLNK